MINQLSLGLAYCWGAWFFRPIYQNIVFLFNFKEKVLSKLLLLFYRKGLYWYSLHFPLGSRIAETNVDAWDILLLVEQGRLKFMLTSWWEFGWILEISEGLIQNDYFWNFTSKLDWGPQSFYFFLNLFVHCMVAAVWCILLKVCSIKKFCPNKNLSSESFNSGTTTKPC